MSRRGRSLFLVGEECSPNVAEFPGLFKRPSCQDHCFLKEGLNVQLLSNVCCVITFSAVYF